jgi:hypothetical protein
MLVNDFIKVGSFVGHFDEIEAESLTDGSVGKAYYCVFIMYIFIST